MSDTKLFENPKMPYFLDLLLVAFDITNNEKVSKDNSEKKPNFWVRDGDFFVSDCLCRCEPVLSHF